MKELLLIKGTYIFHPSYQAMNYLASKIRQRQVWTKPMSKMDECKQLINKTLLAHVPVRFLTLPTLHLPNSSLYVEIPHLVQLSLRSLWLESIDLKSTTLI